MELKIVGSGGMSIIPSSFCKCKICQEARQKGGRYERLGPSLYIDDVKMLIGTPEEIVVTCDRQNITEVKHLSISHSNPDHVKGMGIVEKTGYDFIQEKSIPIEFYALPEVIEDINRMNGDYLKYYGDIFQYISVRGISHVKIDSIDMDLISNSPDKNITFYVIRERSKKVIYACCNPKPFTYSESYFDVEVMAISLVSDDGILRNGTTLKEAPFKDEIWGKSYGYYNELRKLWQIKNSLVPIGELTRL